LNDDRLALEVDEFILATFQGDRGVLLDYDRGEYYGLNDVATFVWKLLKEGCSPKQLVERLTNEYDVPPDLARADLAVLLSNLSARGVVRVRD